MGSLCQGYPLEGKLIMSQRSDQFTLAAFASLLCNVHHYMSTQYIRPIRLPEIQNTNKYTLFDFNRAKPQGGDAYGLAAL